MSITLRESAKSTRLTTLEDVKESVGITTSDDDNLINKYIDRVSRTIEGWTRRRFAREKVTEARDSHNNFRMMLSRLPIVELEEVRFDGGTIALNEFKIEDEEAGFVVRDNNFFTGTQRLITFIHVETLPPRGEREWEFDYTAGWLLADDNICSETDISASAADNSYNSTTTEFPILVAGDTFEVEGFTDNSLNGKKTVVSRTVNKIIVSETLVTEAAGPTIDITVRNLPEDIEQAAIESVKSWYKRKKCDDGIESERIGDWQVKYKPTGVLVDSAEELLWRYRLVD